MLWDVAYYMDRHEFGGLMAAFHSVAGTIRSAMEIQQGLAGSDESGVPRARVRIGIAAGEPVAEGDDLFGAAVQLAARLCQRAAPGSILVSGGVHDLALGKGFLFGRRRRLRLKGFEESVSAYEVIWHDRAPQAEPAEDASRP